MIDHFPNILIFAGSQGLQREAVVGMLGLDVVEATESVLDWAHRAHGL